MAGKTWKKTLMKQGMKLMSDPRVLKMMQDERVMKAVMQVMSVPGRSRRSPRRTSRRSPRRWRSPPKMK